MDKEQILERLNKIYNDGTSLMIKAKHDEDYRLPRNRESILLDAIKSLLKEAEKE